MTGRQRHCRQIGHIPGRHDDAPAVGVGLELVDDLRKTFKQKFGGFLEPVGLMQTKYHFLESPVVPKKD